MTELNATQHEHYPDEHHDVYSKTVFGFWLFLLSDFILFGVLFASYAVLANKTFGGPSAKDLFYGPSALIQAMLLLTAAFTTALGSSFAHLKKKGWTIGIFFITFILGIAFMVMEFSEFQRILSEGYSWKTSAFLSAYFSLIGIHGLHMLMAILWIIVLIIPICYHGVRDVSIKRLACLKLFWQFLNIIWIFIFSFVYLVGIK
ncbi:MAG: Cytochrome bo(3) ubiquinol oxidase subunit 3 [Chlamydiae bacterium]|nr:Cytochrome bo(3) ubiquinol oxidase subunit 3 [Chlamydiota bacterium]